MTRNLRSRVSAIAVFVLLLCTTATYKLCAKDNDNVQPVENLTIIDANGKRVGPVIGFWPTAGSSWGGDATVALRVGGELVILYANENGFTGEENGFTKNMNPLTFESANCSGAVSMPPLSVNSKLAPPHILYGTKLFSLDGPPRTTIVSSLGDSRRGHPCQPFTPEQGTFQPLRFLIDLSTQFTPPFALR